MTLENGAKVIAFDFDGVLHEYHGWADGKLLGPLPGMRDLVTQLFDAGAHCVVHTTREKDVVQPWLRKWGFPHMEVMNTKWTRIDVFVDDRAFYFTPELLEYGVPQLAQRLLDFQPHWRPRA